MNSNIKFFILFSLIMELLVTGSYSFASVTTYNSGKKSLSEVRSLVRRKKITKNKKHLYISPKKEVYYTSKRAIPSGADKIGAGEHAPALIDLPVDKFGLVNWVQAVKQLKIAPIDYKNKRERFYDGTIIYNALNPEWGDVIFDHDVHTYFIDCDSCHPKPFARTPGKAKIFMIKIKNGKFCGKCHGKIAFPIENCERCHILPKTNIKW